MKVLNLLWAELELCSAVWSSWEQNASEIMESISLSVFSSLLSFSSIPSLFTSDLFRYCLSLFLLVLPLSISFFISYFSLILPPFLHISSFHPFLASWWREKKNSENSSENNRLRKCVLKQTLHTSYARTVPLSTFCVRFRKPPMLNTDILFPTRSLF